MPGEAWMRGLRHCGQLSGPAAATVSRTIGPSNYCCSRSQQSGHYAGLSLMKTCFHCRLPSIKLGRQAGSSPSTGTPLWSHVPLQPEMVPGAPLVVL